MKRFTFRLEAALRVRTVHERQARIALGEVLREAADADRAIEQSEQAAEEASARISEAIGAGPLPAGELKLWSSARATLFERGEALERRRRELQPRIDARIAEHARTRRELRVVERLRARDLDAWRTESARAESRESGELFLTRVARQRAEGDVS